LQNTGRHAVAEDPNNHRFWFPAHEAGHAVVAIDAGVIPAFIRQDFSPVDPVGQTAFIEGGSVPTAVMLRIAAAGIAGEFLIRNLEQSSIPEDAMEKAALHRAKSDRKEYASGINIPSLLGEYPQGTTPGQAIRSAIVKTAINRSKPIIEKNLGLFHTIRSTLATSDFVGRASIVKILRGQKPSAFDLRLDRKQEERFRANHEDPTFPLTWKEYMRAMVGW
jgi:hypothetical protein